MPAMQGGVNKSTNGVSSNAENSTPNRPPKSGSRRVLPHFRLPESFRGLTKWKNRQSVNGSKKSGSRQSSGGVRFADEEEPKTEDSFDYKDIDFASEIFDFRVPVQIAGQVKKPIRPPPPPPSSLLPTDSESSATKTVAFDIPLIDEDKENDIKVDDEVVDDEAINDEVMDDIDTREPEVEKIVSNDANSLVVDANNEVERKELTPEEKLTQFLRDHDGQELSKDDVEELEKLLNETDEAELTEEVVEGEKAEIEDTYFCDVKSQTQFEDEIDDKIAVNKVITEVEISQNMDDSSVQLDEVPKGHTDFSVIEFNKVEQQNGSVPKPIKIVVDDVYEPIGEPILNCHSRVRCKLPDMSGFIPPKASTKIGDPFAWRRRGMRRWDRYGYDKNNKYIPATEQIIEGCQQVEHWIMSRHLSPPGYLLEVLGTHRKLKRRKKKKKKPVPTINIIHQSFDCTVGHDSESYEEKVARLILKESFEELRKNFTVCQEQPVEMSGEIVATDILVVSSSPPIDTEISEVETLTVTAVVEAEINKVTENIVIETVESNENILSDTGDGVLPYEVSGHVSRKESFVKKIKPPRPLPPTPVTIADFKPTRPSRRPKRVSSEDRPPSVAEVSSPTEISLLPMQPHTFPRRKESSRRSVSAEEVQRRIQIQAQQFFRTPRKKELKLLSPNRLNSTNFSNTFANSAPPRRRTRMARLTPVYTPINKSCPRKKDFGSQTNPDYDYECEEDTESIPPPPPPKMHHLLTPSIKSNENLTDVCSESRIRVDAAVNQLSNVAEMCGSEKSDLNESMESVSREPLRWSVPPETLEQFSDEHAELSVPPKMAEPFFSTPLTSSSPSEFEESKVSQAAPTSHSPQPSVYASNVPSFSSYLESLANYSNLSTLKLANSDVQVALFCGFLPTGGNLPSNLTELPELTVRRLTVSHLEAGFIKVAEVDAGHMRIERIDQPSVTEPTPSVAVSKPNESSAEIEPSQNKISSEQNVDEPIFHRESSIIDFNGNDSVMSERPSSWDDNSSWTGQIYPSSSSPSYVTCDETLQEHFTDSEFSTDIEDELERDDSSTAGCRTPTPLELDVEKEDDYDLLRQVFAAAVAGTNSSHANSNNESPSTVKPEEHLNGAVVEQIREENAIEVINDEIISHTKPTREESQDVKQEEHEVKQNDSCSSDEIVASTVKEDEREGENDQSCGSNRIVSPDVIEDKHEIEINGSCFSDSKVTLDVNEEDHDAVNVENCSVDREESQEANEEVLEAVNDEDCIIDGEELEDVTRKKKEDENPVGNETDVDVLSSLRRSKSALTSTNRSDYHRKAIKRTVVWQADRNQTASVDQELRVQLVFKSSSVNTPPPVLPRKIKLNSCPAQGCSTINGNSTSTGDLTVSDDFLELPNQSQPVSSEDEASTDSSSEDETTNGDSLESSAVKLPPKSYYIARELMTSERTFVDVLKLLSIDLQQAIAHASITFGHPVIPNDVYSRIFGFFSQLHGLNVVLLQEIEQRILNWDTLPKIADIIVKNGPFLKLYTTYFQNYSELINMLDDACKRYPLFNDALRHFELNERCKKLEVKHYMLKPVQRIPQYRLLLNDYLKHIDETSPDFDDTKKALAVVSEVAEHANETMKETEKFAKLLQIQNSLFGGHQVVKPGRVFLREGDLSKHCRKGIQWRRFILFNDCLLHCSLTSQGLLKVHHELPLSDMTVQIPKKTESPKEFSVLSVARSFILAANSIEEREEWMNAINGAIAAHEVKRSTFLQAKLQNQNGAGITMRNEDLLGQKAPIWVPDSRVTMCQLCLREFTLTFRRHHCRACGKVVCSLCSANRAPLSYLNYQPERVCYECFHILRQEIDSQSRLSVGNGSIKNSDSAEGDKDECNSPKIANIRAQFKSLAPIIGEPKRLNVPKVLQEVSASDPDSTISGYLNKKVRRGWKKQWYVIKDKILYSFKASEDVAALKSTPLLGFKIKTYDVSIEGVQSHLLFELNAGQLSMLFHADNSSSAERWLEELRRAVILE
ncbi:FYVE, RhoGEF and PH domain-containing protein 6 [Chamberlinius hualienensis]